jgi:hypothetical protein
MHGLAQLYIDMGQLPQSQEMIEQAISLLEAKLGRRHIKTAKSLYLKGNLYLRHHSPGTTIVNSIRFEVSRVAHQRGLIDKQRNRWRILSGNS